MAKIGFIGLGNMGLPMAENLIRAGYAVTGFDVSDAAAERLAGGGGTRASSITDACKDAEIAITMLPAGEHVRAVYLGDHGVLASVEAGTLLVDLLTRHLPSAREVEQARAW